MRIFFSKLRSFFFRSADSQEEIQAHLDMLAARYTAQGMSPEQAAIAARRQFGNATLHQQQLRDLSRFQALGNLARDLRFALRQLRKSPGFTLTAVLTLALGIGAATAIFSIVDGVLLKPLAYRNSGQLVVIWERVHFLGRTFPNTGANARHEQIFEQHNTTFSGITLVRESSVSVGLTGERPFFTGRILAEANLLDVLQVQPSLGRSFLPSDAVSGHNQVAILTWPLWQSLFQGDPHVLGRTFHLNEAIVTVIGVMPRDFYFPNGGELSSSLSMADQPGFIMPMAVDSRSLGGLWGNFGSYVAIGRLKPGVTPRQAQAEIDPLCADIVRQIPPSELPAIRSASLASYVQPLKDVIVDKSSRILWLLFAAVLGLLLIACVNLANAQLARAAAHDREVAVRSALGASAWSLVQAAFAETLLLSLAGSVLGILFAWAAVHHVAGISTLPLPRSSSLSVNPVVLMLSLSLTVGATILVGLFPALRQLRIRPQQALQNSARTTGSRSSHLLRRWLIGAQIFACTALLLVTGLFARSLIRLLTLDRGFTSNHILQVLISVPSAGNNDASTIAYDDVLLARLRTLPGVQDAAFVSAILQGDMWQDGVLRPDRAENPGIANYRWISPGYFSTLQQRIVEGRDFDASDRDKRNAVISEITAKTEWPGLDPIGRQFSRPDDGGKLFTVVGVVADAHINSLRQTPTSMVYLPYWVRPNGLFLVRSSQAPSLLADTIRKTIGDYNPNAIVLNIQPLDTVITTSLSPERLETSILTAFGGSALLLALLGIYGTLSYSVESRRQEIGIRMALGATRRNVCMVTLKEIITPVIAGLLLGWLASLAVGRSIAALLYNTAPTDVTVALAVLCLFAVAAAAATFLPCRRAASVDPMLALRTE